MIQFSDLGLDDAILRAVRHEGYQTPTPIQAKAIGPVREGRDLLGCAQTGTGKTAAFALPILHRLSQHASHVNGRGRKIRALVLAPTRELCSQIGESFQTYGRHLPLRSLYVFNKKFEPTWSCRYWLYRGTGDLPSAMSATIRAELAGPALVPGVGRLRVSGVGFRAR